jgi:hypothetical protein
MQCSDQRVDLQPCQTSDSPMENESRKRTESGVDKCTVKRQDRVSTLLALAARSLSLCP